MNGPCSGDAAGHTFDVLREVRGGREYLTLDDPRRAGIERRPFTVEPGRYFMMGDNRDDSNDSRKWGTVRLEEMKGPAIVLYWSWDAGDSWAMIVNPLRWWELLAERTRWSRIGDPIH